MMYSNRQFIHMAIKSGLRSVFALNLVFLGAGVAFAEFDGTDSANLSRITSVLGSTIYPSLSDNICDIQTALLTKGNRYVSGDNATYEVSLYALLSGWLGNNRIYAPTYLQPYTRGLLFYGGASYDALTNTLYYYDGLGGKEGVADILHDIRNNEVNVNLEQSVILTNIYEQVRDGFTMIEGKFGDVEWQIGNVSMGISNLVESSDVFFLACLNNQSNIIQKMDETLYSSKGASTERLSDMVYDIRESFKHQGAEGEEQLADIVADIRDSLTNNNEFALGVAFTNLAYMLSMETRPVYTNFVRFADSLGDEDGISRNYTLNGFYYSMLYKGLPLSSFRQSLNRYPSSWLNSQFLSQQRNFLVAAGRDGIELSNLTDRASERYFDAYNTYTLTSYLINNDLQQGTNTLQDLALDISYSSADNARYLPNWGVETNDFESLDESPILPMEDTGYQQRGLEIKNEKLSDAEYINSGRDYIEDVQSVWEDLTVQIENILGDDNILQLRIPALETEFVNIPEGYIDFRISQAAKDKLTLFWRILRGIIELGISSWAFFHIWGVLMGRNFITTSPTPID